MITFNTLKGSDSQGVILATLALTSCIKNLEHLIKKNFKNNDFVDTKVRVDVDDRTVCIEMKFLSNYNESIHYYSVPHNCGLMAVYGIENISSAYAEILCLTKDEKIKHLIELYFISCLKLAETLAFLTIHKNIALYSTPINSLINVDKSKANIILKKKAELDGLALNSRTTEFANINSGNKQTLHMMEVYNISAYINENDDDPTTCATKIFIENINKELNDENLPPANLLFMIYKDLYHLDNEDKYLFKQTGFKKVSSQEYYTGHISRSDFIESCIPVIIEPLIFNINTINKQIVQNCYTLEEASKRLYKSQVVLKDSGLDENKIFIWKSQSTPAASMCISIVKEIDLEKGGFFYSHLYTSNSNANLEKIHYSERIDNKIFL